MTNEEFLEVMEPLTIRHPKHFSPFVNAAIFKIIGGLSKDHGNEIVGTLLARSRFAPIEEEFKQAVHDLFRPAQFEGVKEETFETIFSDEEREEMWGFIKRAALGEFDAVSIEAYTSALTTVIKHHHDKAKKK